MKKVIAGLGVAVLATFAAPAFAANDIIDLDHSFGFISNELATVVTSVNSNHAFVRNDVDSSASTGGNEIKAVGGDVEDSGIGTGNAVSAAKLDNKVNTILSNVQVSNSCDCTDNNISMLDHSFGKIYNKDATVVTGANSNAALVSNSVESKAKTGHNGMSSFFGDVERSAILSGDAASLAETWSSVNTTASFVTVTRN